MKWSVPPVAVLGPRASVTMALAADCHRHRAESGLNGPKVHLRNACQQALDVDVCLKARGRPLSLGHRTATRMGAGGLLRPGPSVQRGRNAKIRSAQETLVPAQRNISKPAHDGRAFIPTNASEG